MVFVRATIARLEVNAVHYARINFLLRIMHRSLVRVTLTNNKPKQLGRSPFRIHHFEKVQKLVKKTPAFMTTDLCLRLPVGLRRQYLLLLFNTLIRKEPNSHNFITKLFKTVVKKKAQASHILPGLYAHFGRRNVIQTYMILDNHITLHLMNTRVMNEPYCDACLSYKAILKCPCCARFCFCIGCADYGVCAQCE